MNVYELKRKCLGHHRPNIGGSSESVTRNTNVDKRLVTGEGSVGVTADNSSVNLTMTDGGSVARALDSIDLANKLNTTSFSALLGMSDQMFDRGESLIGQTQQAVAQAWDSASTNKSGALDQKTMIALAVVAVIGTYAISKKRG